MSSSSSEDSPSNTPPLAPGSPSSAIKGRVLHRQQSAAIYSEVHLWAETKLDCPIWSLSVSRSGILCGTDVGTVLLFNTNLVLCQSLQAHPACAVLTVQWSGDCLHFLSVGTLDKCVKVWSVEHFKDSPNKDAVCVYSLPQMTRVVSALFHPCTFAFDVSQQSVAGVSVMSKNVAAGSVMSKTAIGQSLVSSANTFASPTTLNTVFIMTADRRVGVWTNGSVERYESLSPKDPPVCMSVSLVSSQSPTPAHGPVFIAVGTRTGELLLYTHSPEFGISFSTSLACRNRQGKYSHGTPIVGISWISDNEMLVSSQDNRVRLVKIIPAASSSSRSLPTAKYKCSLLVVCKFCGHTSSGGEAPLGAFVLRPPFAPAIVQCGSECGRIFVWLLDEGGVESPSWAKRVSLRLKHSRARKSREYWYAVMGTDKITAAAPAPWNPEKGQIGGSCTVTTSLEGYIRLFFNRSKLMGSKRRGSYSSSVPAPEISENDQELPEQAPLVVHRISNSEETQ